MSARDELDEKRDIILNKIDDVEQDLHDIDDEILKKAFERTSVLGHLRWKYQSLLDFSDMLGSSTSDLAKEIQHSFWADSDVVKKAIAGIRAVLFDDTDPVFQSYNCVKVEIEYYRSTIVFMFSNTMREFKISFPMKLWKPKDISTDEVFGGRVSLSTHHDDLSDNFFAASYRLSDIARSISSFVHEEVEVCDYDRIKRSTFSDDLINALYKDFAADTSDSLTYMFNTHQW